MFKNKYGKGKVLIACALVFFSLSAGFLIFIEQKEVKAESLPDLKITNVRFEPEEPVNGQEITPYLTMKNVGGTVEEDPFF